MDNKERWDDRIDLAFEITEFVMVEERCHSYARGSLIEESPICKCNFED